MKITALLISILVLAMLVIPAAAGAETVDTKEAIIHGVTLKPTAVPTTEIIKPVTPIHICLLYTSDAADE